MNDFFFYLVLFYIFKFSIICLCIFTVKNKTELQGKSNVELIEIILQR